MVNVENVLGTLQVLTDNVHGAQRVHRPLMISDLVAVPMESTGCGIWS